MNVGILHITIGESVADGVRVDTDRIARKLCKSGYFVRLVLSVAENADIADTFDFVKKNSDAVLVCGDINSFYDAMGSRYELKKTVPTFLLDDTPCALSQTCDDAFVDGTLIPMLNARCRTFYATVVFRTVGKTEDELRTLLKEYIKNRNKISVKFEYVPPECKVLVRYSNKMQKATVTDVLSGITDKLADCIYAYEDVDVAESVAKILMTRGKTLGLAESFTGGNIAASLVQFAGISSAFKEGIVCYSNEVKESRLRVPPGILRTCGAVSDETAYEMAANLLMDGNYDYVVATTGNAGPTSERPGEVGRCYIAVGNREGIDIYPCRFEGDRASVIHQGTVMALYRLWERLQCEKPLTKPATQTDTLNTNNG